MPASDIDLSPLRPAFREIQKLSSAIRFTFICLVFALSYFNIRAALALPSVELVFKDMLAEPARLPALTAFVLRNTNLLQSISVALPVVGLVCSFARRSFLPIYVLGVVFLLTTLQMILMWEAVSSTVFSIVTKMQNA